MKHKMNLKRFGALIGVFLLVSMYLTTLLLAIFGSPDTLNMFKASIFATVLIPVLLYAYIMIYRFLSGMNDGSDDTDSGDTGSEP